MVSLRHYYGNVGCVTGSSETLGWLRPVHREAYAALPGADLSTAVSEPDGHEMSVQKDVHIYL